MNSQDASPSTKADAVAGKAVEKPQRLRKGDEAGLRKFLETNAPHVHRFALLRLANEAQAAEEVVQATLAEAVRNLGTLHSEAHAGIPMLIWVFRIARLEIKEHLHRRERQTHRQFTAQNFVKLSDAIAGLSSKGHEAAALCADEALRHLVVVIFDRLSELEGAALELKYLGASSSHDVALLLDLTEPQAQKLLARARSSFKNELDRLSRSFRS